MPIYGVTHKTDGTAILRRSVMTKIAIGLPPKDKNDHPKRLNHFIFQKKAQRGSGMSAEVVWEIDEEKTEHYGRSCREVEIILLDNLRLCPFGSLAKNPLANIGWAVNQYDAPVLAITQESYNLDVHESDLTQVKKRT